MFYRGSKTTICDICELDECNDSCKIRADEQRSSNEPDLSKIWESGGVQQANRSWNVKPIYSLVVMAVATVCYFLS